MRLGAISTGLVGIGLTIASTFASSLGLSLRQEQICFAIGVFLALVGAVLFVINLRTQKKKSPALPLLDRLWLKVDEAKALAKQMHDVAPGPTLTPARAWRGEICETLHVEKPDWARRFRESTEEIPQITDQTFFPARLIFEHQIEQLEALLRHKQH